MEQIRRTLLLMIMSIPLLTFGVAVQADAIKSQGPDAPGRIAPDSFGAETSGQVCGGGLCSEQDQYVRSPMTYDKYAYQALAGIYMPAEGSGGSITADQVDVTKEKSEPYAKIVEIRNISEKDNVYRVMFETHAGSENLQRVQILIQSDSESFETEVLGMWANSVHINQFILKAGNPDSVNVEITDYSLNR